VRDFHDVSDGVPPSAVDWAQFQLVAIHLGARSTTGFAVTVRAVVKNPRGATIRVVEETPVPGSWVTRHETQPFVIIRVDRRAGPFSFEWDVREAKSGIGVLGGGRGG
jgi:hypothetical protein